MDSAPIPQPISTSHGVLIAFRFAHANDVDDDGQVDGDPCVLLWVG